MIIYYMFVLIIFLYRVVAIAFVLG
jgi:hypothetical protein